MQKQKYLTKLVNLLNASSSTFMLVALFSLFAIPVVIAQNLDPVLESSDGVPRVVGILDPSLETRKLAENNLLNSEQGSNVEEEGSVLGASDVQNISFFIEEDEKGIKMLSAKSNQTDREYSVNVNYQSKFNKTSIFSIDNVSSRDKNFKLSVVNLGDLKNQSSTGKILYIGEKTYELNKILTNIDLKLAPSEKIVVSLSSPKTNPTNLSINLVIQ